MTTYAELFFGSYTLKSAQLIILPDWTKGGGGAESATDEGLLIGGSITGKRLRNRTISPAIGTRRLSPDKKRRKREPAPAPPPPIPPVPPVPPVPNIASIGNMDVGMGNCALLFDQNSEPVTYFDTGYPVFFYTSSVPNELRPTIGGVVNVNYQGPIMNNAAGTLEVVLSHWDWDHWRLGRVAGLHTIPWTFPAQPVGPSARAFINLLIASGTANPYPAGTPNIVLNDYAIYQCTPPAGVNRAMIMNNSGLALEVNTLLPITDPYPHQFIITGDCNFNNTHIVANNASGIMAVHHGSNNHGATANLPTPVAPFAALGRIAYSYGITGGGNHCYGFPVPAAVAAYQASGWGTPLLPPPPPNQESTAQGNQINGPGVAQRGNIRVGDQAALPAVYAGTAFFNYPNSLT